MNEEVKEKIVSMLDEATFLDLLQLDLADLVAHFDELIDANIEIFEHATNF